MLEDGGPLLDDPISSKAAKMEHRREALRVKLASVERVGWSPRLRMEFDYFTPDECYEGLVHACVKNDTDWLDVGCGRDVFPSNPALADVLAARCRRLTGLDPSDNILENRWLHDRAQTTIEDYRPDRRFNLVTLRMVAEHIADPRAACQALARLTAPGGRLVIYTVARWSISAIAASLTPMAVHHAVKRVLWRTEERDTFPTTYLMNTRRTLARQLSSAGFAEESFERLDDCRAFARWRGASRMELQAWRLLSRFGAGYPEACIIGVYRRLEN